MGLSIHYSGSFNINTSLEEMIEEVKDIAEIYDWECYIFNTHFPDKSLSEIDYDGHLYGISFTPPKSESISLTFLSNGKMCCPSRLQFFGNSEDEKDKMYLYMLSTKTQFAGSTIHKIIIHLLRYLSRKYFDNFKLMDEGGYWETEDESILEKNFKAYNDLFQGFEDSINNYPMTDSESFVDYFSRILKMMDVKRKGRK